MKRAIWIGLLGIFAVLNAYAQSADTTKLELIEKPIRRVVLRTRFKKPQIRPEALAHRVVKDTLKFRPVPRKATLFSFIPGGGQIYNRDYWKVPFVFAAYGAAGYMIHWNSLRYRDYLSAYMTSVDSDGNSTGKTAYDVYIRGQNKTQSLTLDQVKRGKNFYRRYREWGFVAIAASFALSAIEANVAAHLKTFDVSDDLSLRIEPTIQPPLGSKPSPGLRLVFNFK